MCRLTLFKARGFSPSQSVLGAPAFLSIKCKGPTYQEWGTLNPLARPFAHCLDNMAHKLGWGKTTIHSLFHYSVFPIFFGSESSGKAVSCGLKSSSSGLVSETHPVSGSELGEGLSECHLLWDEYVKLGGCLPTTFASRDTPLVCTVKRNGENWVFG